jgi:hypothetical protein
MESDKSHENEKNNELEPEDKATIIDLFDKVLNNDEDAKVVFNSLVDKGGVFTIMELIERSNYKNGTEITKLAITQMTQNEKTEYVFGCRHPDSKPFSWDRAMVVAKIVNSSNITAAVFQNGKDFIGHPKNYYEAYKCYAEFIKNGWIPMKYEDLKKTSGVDIDECTIIEPFSPKKWHFEKYILSSFVCVAIAIFGYKYITSRE